MASSSEAIVMSLIHGMGDRIASCFNSDGLYIGPDGDSDYGSDYDPEESANPKAVIKSLKRALNNIQASIRDIHLQIPDTDPRYKQMDIFRLYEQTHHNHYLLLPPQFEHNLLYAPPPVAIKDGIQTPEEDQRLDILNTTYKLVRWTKSELRGYNTRNEDFERTVHQLDDDFLLLSCTIIRHCLVKANPNFGLLNQRVKAAEEKKTKLALQKQIAEPLFFNPRKPGVIIKITYEEPLTNMWAFGSIPPDTVTIPFIDIFDSTLIGAVLMLDPSYRSSTYDPKEKIIYDPIHTKSPLYSMQNTVIYLRPLSKSRIGMKQADYHDFVALTDSELLEAVRVWAEWIEEESVPKFNGETKEKHKLFARFLGLPDDYLDALDFGPFSIPSPVFKSRRLLQSKSTPLRASTPHRASTPPKNLPLLKSVILFETARLSERLCLLGRKSPAFQLVASRRLHAMRSL